MDRIAAGAAATAACLLDDHAAIRGEVVLERDTTRLGVTLGAIRQIAAEADGEAPLPPPRPLPEDGSAPVVAAWAGLLATLTVRMSVGATARYPSAETAATMASMYDAAAASSRDAAVELLMATAPAYVSVPAAAVAEATVAAVATLRAWVASAHHLARTSGPMGPTAGGGPVGPIPGMGAPPGSMGAAARPPGVATGPVGPVPGAAVPASRVIDNALVATLVTLRD